MRRYLKNARLVGQGLCSPRALGSAPESGAEGGRRGA